MMGVNMVGVVKGVAVFVFAVVTFQFAALKEIGKHFHQFYFNL